MNDKKGFSGLDSLSTDIDDIIRENDKRIEDNTEQKKENKDNISNSNNDITDNVEKSNINTDNNSNTSNVASDNSNNGSSSWIWWLIVIGIFVWILIQSNSNSSYSNKSTYSQTTTPSTPSTPNTNNKYESAKSDQECYSKGMYPSIHYSDGSVLCSSSSVESLSSSSQQNYNTNTSSDDYYESKPDVYLSILNKNQVLYCEAEKIRLDAVQNKIDLYSTYEVDTYNSLTNDYNSRCANKQYYKNDMYYVDRNIEKKRYQLQQDGLARFPKSNSISSNSQSYNSNQPKNQTPNINSKILYSLTINTLPSDAKVKIVNITPKYQNGIKLEKGSYHLEVSKDGYETYINSIILEKDLIYSIELKKINKNNKSIQDLNTEKLNMSGLSNSQIENIKSACSLDYYNGPAAYNECMNKKIKALKTTPEPNMSGLSNSQIENIKSACSLDYYNGPAAYNECMNKKIKALKTTPEPNMSGLSNSQIENIKSACSLDYYNGPAAYNECMNNKIKALKTTPEPNMSGLSNSQIENIKSACSLDYYNGPAAYNECMNKKIKALKTTPEPNMSGLSNSQIENIKSACSLDYYNGPAAYNECMNKKIKALGK